MCSINLNALIQCDSCDVNDLFVDCVTINVNEYKFLVRDEAKKKVTTNHHIYSVYLHSGRFIRRIDCVVFSVIVVAVIVDGVVVVVTALEFHGKRLIQTQTDYKIVNF